MTADSCRHVECYRGFDSFHSSRSRRSEAGRLGECRLAPATGRVQTQRFAAKIEQPRSIISDRLYMLWPGWKSALIFVKPETVTSWHHKRFRRYWWKLSQPKEPRNVRNHQSSGYSIVAI